MAKLLSRPKGKAVLQCSNCGWPILLASNIVWSRPEVDIPVRWASINGMKCTLMETEEEFTGLYSGKDRSGNRRPLMRRRDKYRITGHCPNSNCNQFFEVHSPYNSINLPSNVQNSSIRTLVLVRGVVECSQETRLDTSRVSLDWIPSPRGVDYFQRLILSDTEKTKFAVIARSALRTGVPHSSYPDWYPEASAELFAIWSHDLTHTYSEHLHDAPEKGTADAQKRLVRAIRRRCQEASQALMKVDCPQREAHGQFEPVPRRRSAS